MAVHNLRRLLLMVETHWLCERNPDVPVKERSLNLVVIRGRTVGVRSIWLALPNVVVCNIVRTF